MGSNVVKDMSETAQVIRKLRADLLFDDVEGSGCQVLGPLSEQYYLLALDALEQAHRYMQLAHIHAMRGD
jgi:hypothetical protein